MKPRFILTFILTLSLLIISLPTYAMVEVSVYGPEDITKTGRRPTVYTDTFTISGLSGPGKLIITNHGDKWWQRIRFAKIWLNDQVICMARDFRGFPKTFTKVVNLQETNEIKVKMWGARGKRLSIEVIKEEDADTASVCGPGGCVIEGVGAMVEIPADALAEDTVITIKEIKLPAPLPGDSQSASKCFDFKPDGIFNEPVTITLSYDDFDNDRIIDGTGVFEGNTGVYYFDEIEEKWIGIFARSFDTEKNTISIKIDHFTKFVSGASENSIKVPVDVKYWSAESTFNGIEAWIENGYFPIMIDYSPPLDTSSIKPWIVIVAPKVVQLEGEPFSFEWGVDLSEEVYENEFLYALPSKGYKEIYFAGWEWAISGKHCNTVWVKNEAKYYDNFENATVLELPYSPSYRDYKSELYHEFIQSGIKSLITSLIPLPSKIEVPVHVLSTITEICGLTYSVCNKLYEYSNPIVGVYPITDIKGTEIAEIFPGIDHSEARISLDLDKISAQIHMDYIKYKSRDVIPSQLGHLKLTPRVGGCTIPALCYEMPGEKVLLNSSELDILPTGKYFIVTPKVNSMIDLSFQTHEIGGKFYLAATNQFFAEDHGFGLSEITYDCPDEDGDGYFRCSETGGEIDCIDNNMNINPGEMEKCDDGKDNDCDGEVDEGCVSGMSHVGYVAVEHYYPSDYWLAMALKDGYEATSIEITDPNGQYLDHSGNEMTLFTLNSRPDVGDEYTIYIQYTSGENEIYAYIVENINDDFAWVTYPSDGAEINETNPTFTWTVADNVDTYRLDLWGDQGKIWDSGMTKANSASYPGNLEPGKTYSIYMHVFYDNWNQATTLSNFTVRYDNEITIPTRTITVDGNSNDWSGIDPIITDAEGDSICELGTDIKQLYLAQDDYYLYWRVDTSSGNFAFGERILVLLFYETGTPQQGPYPNGITVNVNDYNDAFVSARYTNNEWTGLYGGSEYGSVNNVAEGKILLYNFRPFNIEFISAYYWKGNDADPQCDDAPRGGKLNLNEGEIPPCSVRLNSSLVNVYKYCYENVLRAEWGLEIKNNSDCGLTLKSIDFDISSSNDRSRTSNFDDSWSGDLVVGSGESVTINKLFSVEVNDYLTDEDIDLNLDYVEYELPISGAERIDDLADFDLDVNDSEVDNCVDTGPSQSARIYSFGLSKSVLNDPCDPTEMRIRVENTGNSYAFFRVQASEGEGTNVCSTNPMYVGLDPGQVSGTMRFIVTGYGPSSGSRLARISVVNDNDENDRDTDSAPFTLLNGGSSCCP